MLCVWLLLLVSCVVVVVSLLVGCVTDDGASRGQGLYGVGLVGFGAVVWAATEDGRALGPPFATCRGLLGLL